ncbi:outer membrane beta-barrel protein [Spirosoma montaniterrae]|uniref:Outer membrane protein beta-barrel domain-containing protein n=1 Tax=Spirosoma montaniterrae TaxID=1178516 RepID=A0A1P9WYI1_9BACT|nr:outer membrane beta-barrel protein [Spirosoma montaniterrae]AQG80435.1 hypothetical protein AWR27_14550 [Spirosoma montaniterrae]
MNTVKHLLTSAFIAASATAFAQTTVTITTQTDSTVTTVRKPARSFDRVVNDFSIYLGINAFGAGMPTGYDFRPIGSRFVALAWHKRIPLGTSGSTKFRLITGPEVAWNNFMFEGNNRLIEQNNQLIVEAAPNELRKSKVVTTQLNLPLMLNIKFRSRFTLNAGAYAGMRLDSYTSVKPVGGSTVRTHGAFNLNPIRWGLTTELGFRGEGKLFVRYEPNSPFRSGEGPNASVWAVGVKL